MDEKILIVDDALFMRVNLKRILTEAGYKNLLEAENGEVACGFMRRRSRILC